MIIQLIAGIKATLGGLIFLIQFGHSTKGATLLWTGLNLSLIYFFIFEPVQELKRRKIRYYKSSFSKRQRPWRGIKPGATFGYAFFASLIVTLVEFTIALFKGGLIFAVKWLIALPILTQIVSDHLDHKSASSNYIQPIMLPANQVHLAATLYFVWFGLIILLVFGVVINDIFVYPTLNDPVLRDSVSN